MGKIWCIADIIASNYIQSMGSTWLACGCLNSPAQDCRLNMRKATYTSGGTRGALASFSHYLHMPSHRFFRQSAFWPLPKFIPFNFLYHVIIWRGLSPAQSQILERWLYLTLSEVCPQFVPDFVCVCVSSILKTPNRVSPWCKYYNLCQTLLTGKSFRLDEHCYIYATTVFQAADVVQTGRPWA